MIERTVLSATCLYYFHQYFTHSNFYRQIPGGYLRACHKSLGHPVGGTRVWTSGAVGRLVIIQKSQSTSVYGYREARFCYVVVEDSQKANETAFNIQPVALLRVPEQRVTVTRRSKCFWAIKTELCGFSLRANYTDRATAACRRS
jgi:hypothetical protein